MSLVAYRGRPTVDGLSDLVLSNVVSSHMDAIRATIDQHAPDREGIAHFSIEVEQGEVVRALVRTSFGVPELDAALASLLADWRLPALDEHGAGATGAAEWEVRIAPPPVMTVP